MSIVDCGGVTSSSSLKYTALAAALMLVVPRAFAADARSDEALWRSFRERNLFHTQTIALSDRTVDGERVMVIAEPPPTLPRGSFQDALEGVFRGVLKKAEIRKHPMGFDGWVEDVVLTLRYASPEEEQTRLAEDCAMLATRLFGTAYKFAPARLPDKPRARAKLLAPPGLIVRVDELKSWLLDAEGEGLISLEFGTPHNLKNLLAAKSSRGVYLTSQRGLVVLILPRQEIERSRADIRKFALDTDAIVGAIDSGNASVAVIGRERDTSLEAVPPLRAETVIGLAATEEKELGQSYERNAAFAGKLENGPHLGKDWAPIYLSRDLCNTEFGSILNITDQLLKSWSESGKVEYHQFAYPKPSSFPFENGLFDHLASPQVTYNWNTVGVGSVSEFGGTRIFALARTGSLPVSFIAGGETSAGRNAKGAAAENRGFDYFSTCRDPYLGRVVQYAGLYQIFRAFGVRAGEADYQSAKNTQAPAQLLASEAKKALRIIADADFEAELADKEADLTRLKLKLLFLTSILPLQDSFGEEVVERLAVVMADRSAMVLDKDSIKNVRGVVAGARSAEEMIQRLQELPAGDRRIAIDLLLLSLRKPAQDLLRSEEDLDSVREKRLPREGWTSASRAMQRVG